MWDTEVADNTEKHNVGSKYEIRTRVKDSLF